MSSDHETLGHALATLRAKTVADPEADAWLSASARRAV